MKKLLTIFAVICSLGVAMLASPRALALRCPAETPNGGADVNSIAECSIKPTSGGDAKKLTSQANNAINLVISFVGVAAVIMIILGGIQYITSQGDAAKATKGRTIIIYGVVGMVICVMAFALVNFVLTGVFG